MAARAVLPVKVRCSLQRCFLYSPPTQSQPKYAPARAKSRTVFRPHFVCLSPLKHNEQKPKEANDKYWIAPLLFTFLAASLSLKSTAKSKIKISG
ncbi:MAG: hypothetical protein V3U75_04800 [Methylococcaceae bacterium]